MLRWAIGPPSLGQCTLNGKQVLSQPCHYLNKNNERTWVELSPGKVHGLSLCSGFSPTLEASYSKYAVNVQPILRHQSVLTTRLSSVYRFQDKPQFIDFLADVSLDLEWRVMSVVPYNMSLFVNTDVFQEEESISVQL